MRPKTSPETRVLGPLWKAFDRSTAYMCQLRRQSYCHKTCLANWLRYEEAYVSLGETPPPRPLWHLG